MTVRKLIACLLAVHAFAGPVVGQVPLTLRQALQQVRTNSPALRVERLNIPVAQADQITANLRPNPILNNQTLFQLGQGPTVPASVDQTVGALSRQRRQFWLQATKEFDIFNKRQYRNRFAEARATLATRAVDETERGLLFDAANRYLDTWFAHIQLNLLQRAKANVDTLVQLNKIRLKDLVISSTDLTRTQLLSDQYDIQTRTARQELLNRQNELRLVLGARGDIDVASSDSLVDMSAYLPAPDSLLRLAATTRADVREAEANLETARRNVDLQQVLARPRNEAGIIWNPQNAVPYAGVFLTLELPVYARNQGEIQKSRVLVDQAGQAASLVQVRLRSEIETAYQSFVTSRQNVDRYTGIRRDADRVLASVRYAYLRGATTLIDLLEAQRSWFDTQTGYYQTLYAYRQSFVRLLYVSGQINTY